MENIIRQATLQSLFLGLLFLSISATLHSQPADQIPLPILEKWEAYTAVQNTTLLQPCIAAQYNEMALEEFLRGNDSWGDRLLKRALKMMRSRYWRKDNPGLASAITNVALINYRNHAFSAAGKFFDSALAMRRRLSNGADDLGLATAIANLGIFSYNRGEFLKAESLLCESIMMYRRLCKGEAHAGFAETLFNAGILYNYKKNYPRADSLINEALCIFRTLASEVHSPQHARTLEDAATLYSKRYEYPKACGLYMELLTAWQQWNKGTAHPDIARNLGSIGLLYDTLGNYARADSCLTAALKMSRVLRGKEGDSTLALRLVSLGSLHARHGDFEKAKPLLEEGLKIQRKLHKKHHRDLAWNLAVLARLHGDRGDYSRAIPLFEESLFMYRKLQNKLDGFEHAGIYMGLGEALHGVGDYKEAGAKFLEARDMYKRRFHAKDHPLMAEIFAHLGNLYTDRGDYARGEEYLKQSLTMYSRLFPDSNDPGFARALQYMARYHHQRGNLEKSEVLIRDALGIFGSSNSGPYQRYRAACLRDLSASRAERGDTAEALALLREGLELLQCLHGNVDYFDLALTLSRIGALQLEQKNYEEARGFLENALAMYDRLCAGKDHPDRAAAIRTMAMYHSYKENAAMGAQLFRSSLNMYRRLYEKTGHLDLTFSIYAIARSAEMFGMNDLARECYQELLRVLPRATKASSLFEGEEQQIRLQERLMQASHSILGFFLRHNATRELYDATLWAKGRVLGAVELRNYLLMELGARDTNVVALWREFQEVRRFLSDTRGESDPDQLRKKRQEKLAIAEDIEGKLTRLSATFKGVQRREITWRGIKKRLGRDDRAVEFIRIAYADDAGRTDSAFYYALVLHGKSSKPRLVKLCNEREIEDILRHPVDHKDWDADSYIHYGARRRKLYDLVWGPIEPFLNIGGHKRIYVSADGLLNHIALGVLTNSADTMMLDRYDIRYLFSSRDMVPRSLPESSRNVSKTAVVLGGIRFDTDSKKSKKLPLNSAPKKRGVGSPLQALDGTRQEAESVAATLNRHHYDVTTYTDFKATEEAFIMLESPAVLHIATHGFFFPDPDTTPDVLEQMLSQGGIRLMQCAEDPLLRSGILLAGANHVWTLRPPKVDICDGVVTAHDIAHMNLSNTALVVLSACETGLGELRGGEGVFGLKRAFRAAGAQAVIMTLWKVPDEETRKLMTLFYEKWLDGNMDKARALAEAQREMVRETNDPYYWGAFVLVGE